MSTEIKIKHPDIIFRDGKPTAVIVDIADYQELIERCENIDDIKALEEMRNKPLDFTSLDDFLAEYNPEY